jgi:hypothetical protein
MRKNNFLFEDTLIIIMEYCEGNKDLKSSNRGRFSTSYKKKKIKIKFFFPRKTYFKLVFTNLPSFKLYSFEKNSA